MLRIRKTALLSALHGAKETHPDEFICLLRGEKITGGAKVAGKDGKSEKREEGDWLISEVIIPPFASYELNASSFSPWFIPANSKELATFHSHPSPNTAYPSRQDLKMFSNSTFNFIACFPYGVASMNAFDSKGKRIAFEIVD